MDTPASPAPEPPENAFQPGSAQPEERVPSLRAALVLLTLLVTASWASSHLGLGAGSGTDRVSFVVLVFSLARVIVESAASKPVRVALGKLPLVGGELYETDEKSHVSTGLLTCYLCAGTWLGLALADLGVRFVGGESAVAYLGNAFCGGGIACAVEALVALLEARARY